MKNYIELISEFYPNTKCYSTGANDDYIAVVWETAPISQAELDVVYLTKYKTDKIIMFSELARQDIEQGFPSSALGFPHWYDAQPEDQMNLIGSVATDADMYYSSRPYTKPKQVINFGGVITTGLATGLANDTTTYTAEIKVNGVSSYISVRGMDCQTYGNLITHINSDIALNSTAQVVLETGNLTLYGGGYGSTHTIEIIDVTLGMNLSNFVSILPMVVGMDGKNGSKTFKLHTHANLLTVINDGKDIKLMILQKFAVKKDQTIYAASLAAVDAISW